MAPVLANSRISPINALSHIRAQLPRQKILNPTNNSGTPAIVLSTIFPTFLIWGYILRLEQYSSPLLGLPLFRICRAKKKQLALTYVIRASQHKGIPRTFLFSNPTMHTSSQSRVLWLPTPYKTLPVDSHREPAMNHTATNPTQDIAVHSDINQYVSSLAATSYIQDIAADS